MMTDKQKNDIYSDYCDLQKDYFELECDYDYFVTVEGLEKFLTVNKSILVDEEGIF